MKYAVPCVFGVFVTALACAGGSAPGPATGSAPGEPLVPAWIDLRLGPDGLAGVKPVVAGPWNAFDADEDTYFVAANGPMVHFVGPTNVTGIEVSSLAGGSIQVRGVTAKFDETAWVQVPANGERATLALSGISALELDSGTVPLVEVRLFGDGPTPEPPKPTTWAVPMPEIPSGPVTVKGHPVDPETRIDEGIPSVNLPGPDGELVAVSGAEVSLTPSRIIAAGQEWDVTEISPCMRVVGTVALHASGCRAAE